MRPICHKCKIKPSDIVEGNKFWCASCKVEDMHVKGMFKHTSPELTNKSKRLNIKTLR